MGSRRELYPDILDATRRAESDELDARVAKETGLAARTCRDVRLKLQGEGLLKPEPDKDEGGTVVRWYVRRTNATR